MISPPTLSKRVALATSRLGGVLRVGLALLALASGAIAEEAAETVPIDVTYSTGFDFSRGDYGFGRDSSLYYVPLGVTVDRGYFRFRATVPLLYNDGSVTVGGGVDPVNEESERTAGLGQIITGASYLIDPPVEALPWVEIGGQILWPTRTAEILGTGGFGFTTQLDFFEEYRIGTAGDDAPRRAPSITPFVTVGRNFYVVDSLRDRFFTTAGFAVRATDVVSAGVAYDWFETAVREIDDAHQIVPYLSFTASPHWTLGPYAVVGLSEGAPDYGVGLSVRYRP